MLLNKQYRGADKSLARPGRKQANVSVRMAWISFGALLCRKKKTWQLASRCCWSRACPWHASELVSFLVGLRTYQHPGKSGSSNEPCAKRCYSAHAVFVNPLNAELSLFSHLLTLLGAQHILHVSRVRVKPAWLRNIFRFRTPQYYYRLRGHCLSPPSFLFIRIPSSYKNSVIFFG